MFKTLQIQNFRGIKSAELEGLEQINLLFGKNNCGKSTILEALFLITGQSNPALPISINSMRNYMQFSEGDLNIEFYQLNPENKITISATGDKNRRLEITQIKSHSTVVNLDSLPNGNSDNSGKTYGLKLNYSIGENGTNYSSELTINEGEPENGKVTIDKRYKEDLFSQYIPSSTSQPSLFEEFARIIANKKEDHILSSLRKIEPSIKDIQLVGQEILVDIGAQQRLPINMMGDGLRKLLMIIISIYRCRDGVLLIDEIDNGFHFSAMKVLWQAILSAAKDNNVQLFASTHNIDSLKGLSQVLKDKGYTCFQKDVGAFKLIKTDSGDVTAIKYDYESFQYSINQELEMR